MDSSQPIPPEKQYSIQQSEERLRYLLADAPVAIAVFTGMEMVIESANKKILEVWGKTADVVGKPLYVALPELAGQDFLHLLQNVYKTGIPFYGNEIKALIEKNGVIEEVWSNFAYQPLKDDQGQTTSIILTANEITEQVLARKKIEDSERRLRNLVMTTPIGMTILRGRELIVEMANQKMLDIWNHEREEVIGKPLLEIFPELTDQAYPSLLESVFDTGQSVKMPEMAADIISPHGNKHIFIDFSYDPLFDADGNVESIIATVIDVSEQVNARRIVQENEKKKDEFMSIVSLELKTPITNIKTYNQLLQQVKQPDQRAPLIIKSAEYITRLERLIDDLLDVTRINAGKMSYTMETFSFGQLLAESVENVRLTVPGYEIVLNNFIQTDYTGDHFRLEQVINNLMSNAIKYSRDIKKIIVTGAVEHNNIIVSIQDYGIGIEEKKLDQLFDRYYRADNISMRFEGLGLGLFISSEILKGHQGDFWIESEAGKGSTFYFRLPISHKQEDVLKTETLYRDSTITIRYNKTGHRLDADWTGFQTLESVQRGGMMLFEMLTKYKCHKIVNDNTHVLGSWSEAAEWAGTEWFPMMDQAGLHYFAWIYSPSVFSRMAANKSADIAIGNVRIQFFTDLYTAREWIEMQPDL